MLHRIEPACEAQLRNVIEFQRRVLEFACRPDLTIHQQGQSKKLDRTQANAHFGAQAQWFWDHTSLHPFVIAVNTPVRGNALMRQNVLGAFDNDTGFDKRVDDAAFLFGSWTLHESVRESVRNLLRQFYKIFEQGFAAEITGSGTLTRAEFVAEFWTVNADLKVCPACSGKMEEAGAEIHSRCDHHFPKSRYGTLSVHPLNLVPLCPWCNEVFKKENDANDRARLSEMFLPYAAGREMLGNINVIVARGPNGEYLLEFDDNGNDDTPRLRALNYVVELQDRWESRLRKDVAPPIVTRLNGQRNLVQRLNLDPIEIPRDIDVQRQGYESRRRTERDAVLSEAFCSFLANSPGEWS